jgi:hypothetical protein
MPVGDRNKYSVIYPLPLPPPVLKNLEYVHHTYCIAYAYPSLFTVRMCFAHVLYIHALQKLGGDVITVLITVLV